MSSGLKRSGCSTVSSMKNKPIRSIFENVAGVVFGDVPFVGAILGNFTDLVGTLGDSGAVGALVLALLVGLYN